MLGGEGGGWEGRGTGERARGREGEGGNGRDPLLMSLILSLLSFFSNRFQ